MEQESQRRWRVAVVGGDERLLSLVAAARMEAIPVADVAACARIAAVTDAALGCAGTVARLREVFAGLEQTPAVVAVGAGGLPLDQVGPQSLAFIINQAVELAGREAQLRILALRDPLTGLVALPLFWEILAHAVRRARRYQLNLAVIMLDIALADPAGRDLVVCEEMQRRIGGVLTGLLRSSDTVARIGRDRFALLIESLSEIADAQIVVEKIIEALTAPAAATGPVGGLLVRAGIALYPTSAAHEMALVEMGEQALEAACAHPGSNFIFR